MRRKEDKKCVGVSLNFDAYDEPEEIELSQGITYALEILGKAMLILHMLKILMLYVKLKKILKDF